MSRGTEITTKGNLPPHLQILAVEKAGQRTVRFWEYKTCEEMAKSIKEDKLEEAGIEP